MPNITALIVVATVMFCVLGGVTLLAHIYNLNNIKSKTVGDGQHGRGAVAAGRNRVDPGEGLGRLQDVDSLLLQVLGRGREPPGLEYGVELHCLHRPAVKLLARISLAHDVKEIHITYLP